MTALDGTQITGRISLPNNVSPANAVVRFTLSGFDTDAASDITVVQRPVDATIDANGDIDVNLWGNVRGTRTRYYSAAVIIRDADNVCNIPLGQISVPDSASALDLNDLLPIAPPTGATVSDYIAQLAASAASTAADAVSTAADAVATAADAVATAADRVQTGQDVTATAADRALAQTAATDAQSSALTVATWAILNGLTGSTDGTGAEVLDADTGTHTDPVAGGTVNNAGRYSWSATPAGWERIGDTGLSAKVDNADLEVRLTETSGALLTETARQSGSSEVEVANAAVSADNPVDIVADSKGNVVTEIRADGRHDHTHTNEWSVPVDGNAQAGLTDEAGNPVLTVASDGVRLHGFEGLGEVFADGGERERRIVYADETATTDLTTFENDGDCFAPRITADRKAIRYVSNLTGRAMPFVMGIDGKNRMVFVGEVEAVYAYGQSLSVGVQTSPPTANTTAPLFPGVNLMSNGADRGTTPRIINDPTLNPDERDTIVEYGRIAELVDLREAATVKCGQTFLSRLGAQLQASSGFNGARPIVFNTFGVGGASYSYLAPDEEPWANLCRTANEHRRMAEDLGLRFKILALVFVHGHSNAAVTQSTYLGYLIELETALSALCRDLGQTELPCFAVTGLATSKFGSTTRSEVPLAQLEFGTGISTLSKRVFAGPDYIIPIGADGTHPTANGYDEMGDRIGIAIREAMLGSGWSPLRISGATGAGTNTVVVSFEGADGNIVLDTSVISDPGGYGFEIFDDGGEVTVSSATVINNGTQVQLNLAATLGANPRLDYALSGPADAPASFTSGVRGCVRDSRPGTISNSTPAHQYCASGTGTIS